jgi:hypothetical protein
MSITTRPDATVTLVVQRQESARWAAHVARLRQDGSVATKVLDAVLLMTAAHCIGYVGGGSIRPGDIGRWDVYEMILQYVPMATKTERARAANISDDELMQDEGGQEMHLVGMDPTDPAHVDIFRELQGLGEGELEMRVMELQGVLEAMS